MPALLLILALVMGVFGNISRVEACSCMPTDVMSSYRATDQAVHVRVLGMANRTRDSILYSARLMEDSFKGCLRAHARVLIQVARSSAACGITLTVGQEHLIFGNAATPALGQLPTIRTGLCQANTLWRALTQPQLAFLHSRYNCCGDKCACTDGSQPVNCFVDPCQVSSCDVAGAVCEANYCGGCNAEWYDAANMRVCAQFCDYDDPARRYVARSRDACAAVRFACEPDEQPFFDDCGCGCETVLCDEAECGPQLGMPNILCPDGVTVAGPTGRCLRQADGTCGWEVISCPPCTGSSCGTPCASSAQCAGGEYCTTEDGVCNRPPGCGPSDICPAVCYGVCRPELARYCAGKVCGDACAGPFGSPLPTYCDVDGLCRPLPEPPKCPG